MFSPDGVWLAAWEQFHELSPSPRDETLPTRGMLDSRVAPEASLPLLPAPAAGCSQARIGSSPEMARSHAYSSSEIAKSAGALGSQDRSAVDGGVGVAPPVAFASISNWRRAD